MWSEEKYGNTRLSANASPRPAAESRKRRDTAMRTPPKDQDCTKRERCDEVRRGEKEARRRER